MSQTPLLESQPSVAKPRKRKWLYRVLWSSLALILGACLCWTWARQEALAERDALIAQIHAKGEPVWWNEVVDKALAEQPENSGAPMVRDALAIFDDVSKDFSKSLPQIRDDQKNRSAFEGWKLNPEHSKALKASAPAFDLMEKAVRLKPGLLKPNLRDIDGPGWLPHMATPALRRLLSLRVFDALTRNDSRDAYRTVALTLRGADQFSADPLHISLIAGFAMRTTACGCLPECLSQLPPSPEEFRDLDQLLSAYDDGFNIAFALIGERARCLEALENDAMTYDLLAPWRGHWSRDMRGPERWAYHSWLYLLATPAGAPIRVRTESEVLRFTERTMPIVDSPTTLPETVGDAFQDFQRRSPFDRAINNEVSPNLLHEWSIVGKSGVFRRLHQRMILTRLALRLRRYHDKHGKFPGKLDELCDEAMPKIRLDWFGNQPITYTPSANAFRLVIPKSIVPEGEHFRLKESPISSDYGLELELKKLP